MMYSDLRAIELPRLILTEQLAFIPKEAARCFVSSNILLSH